MVYVISNRPQLFEQWTTCRPDEAIQWLNTLEEIQADTETKGFNLESELITLQLGNKERQYIIDVASVDLKLFKHLLESKLILFHNAAFDLRFLFKYDIYLRKVYDTMLAERVLYCNLNSGFSLDYLAHKYCNQKLKKGNRTLIQNGFSKEAIEYCAEDVMWLSDIKIQQTKKAIEDELTNCITLENMAVLGLAMIAFNGMLLDKEGWLKDNRKDKEELLGIERELDKLLISKKPSIRKELSIITDKHGKRTLVPFMQDLFNPNAEPVRFTQIVWSSNPQVAKILREQYNTVIVDQEGKETTNSKFVEFYKNRVKSSPDYATDQDKIDLVKFLEVLIQHREKSKLISTYGKNFIEKYIYSDGRIRTTFNQIQATGRTSSGDKDKKGEPRKKSPNTQNIPEEKRKFFIATPGRSIVTMDYSQQEPRITADKTQDPALVDLFINGNGDTHSMMASKMYSVILNKEVIITKESPYVEIEGRKINARQIGKVLNLKLDYGGTAFTVKDDLNCSIAEAEVFVKAAKDAFPRKQNYFDKKFAQTVRNGYILIDPVTLRRSYMNEVIEYKRLADEWDYLSKEDRRTFFKLEGKIKRNSQNYPIQGTGASMMKLAIAYCYNHIVENNIQHEVKMINTVHDEIVFDIHNNYLHHTEHFKNAMVKSGNIFCKTIPMKVEPVISNKWEKE